MSHADQLGFVKRQGFLIGGLDTSRPIDFEVSAGFTVKASSAAIAFLWSNWEVLYAFRPEQIRAVRSIASDVPGLPPWDRCGHWEAAGFGGSGNWSLERAEIGVKHGRFSYFTRGRAIGCPFCARTVMEYDRIDDRLVSYRGTGIAALPRLFRPLHPLLKLLGARITVHINKIGGEVAELITSHPEAVREVAGEAAWEAYNCYIREEDAVRKGSHGSLHLFSCGDQLPAMEPDDVQFLKRRLQRMEELLESIHAKGVDPADYRTSLSVFAHDPHLALLKNSLIVEKIANLVYERETGVAPYGVELRKRLSDLQTKSLNVPKSVLALMGIVVDLGETNSRTTNRTSALDFSAYSISFEVTLRITEWFFSEYLDEGTRLT